MRKFKNLVIGIIALLTLILSGCTGLVSKEVKEKELVKVGISWERVFPNGVVSEDVQMYIDSVKMAGAEPVLLPQIKTEEDALNALKTVDAVILTGGEDIDPAYYNEQPHPNLYELSKERDLSDFLLLKTAVKEDYPVLGTCRGMQFLNVVLGGTLYQDLPTEYISNLTHRDPKGEDFVSHDCKITDKNSKLYNMLKVEDLTVNSWHHQAIERLGKGLKVTALSSDGIIEAVELEGATFVIGTQFHPEWHVGGDKDEMFLPIFETLIEYGAKNRKK